MTITACEIAELNIKLKKPFITALRRVECVNDIIIKIHTDTEFFGYGEACAVTAITGVTNEQVRKELQQTVFPFLLQQDIDEITIFTKLYALEVSTETKACVDIALYDLLAKQYKKSLHSYLGSTSSVLQTDLTISVNEPKQMQEDTIDALAQGFNILKIKLDKDIDKNIQRLEAINMLLSSEYTLRLDPNQSLDLQSCLSMLLSINLENIECIEQPFNAKDIKSMKLLKDKGLVPVLADESIFDADDAKKLLKDEAADMLNIKLMKCGGIHEAIAIAKLSKQYGKECMIGSMLEGPISLLAAAHFGLSQDNISMADLDSPLYLKNHPLLEPFHLEKDFIHLNNEPGLGIDTIMEKLKLFKD